ncbi:Ribonuclease P protein component 3 [Candidatus Burarchaeum australiense]|nr:Ribonuclease P protein component 3 [Candidatus Burarchaeum australiense]
MAYHDLHVRFKPSASDLRELGFASACTAGERVQELVARNEQEISQQAPKEKISILAGEDAELLRRGVKRFDLLFVSSFYPDTALMREVAREEKAFEVPINGLLRSGGYARANLLARMRFFLKLCTKYKADYVLTSRAADRLEMKNVDELVAIGAVLGLDPPQVKKALSVVPERVMEGANP